MKYKSDGTGRDSYVVSNNGGLVADFRCRKPDVIFQSGLRQHYLSPLRNPNERWRGPDGTDYLNWIRPQDRVGMTKAAIKQKELTKRLSPPKYGPKFGSLTLTDGFYPDSSLASVKINQVSRLDALRNSRFSKRNKSVMPNTKIGWAG